MPVLLYGTEACLVNSAVRHYLQFALNRALFKIFGALSKYTYQDICKYFGIWTVEKQISARKSKFNLR